MIHINVQYMKVSRISMRVTAVRCHKAQNTSPRGKTRKKSVKLESKSVQVQSVLKQRIFCNLWLYSNFTIKFYEARFSFSSGSCSILVFLIQKEPLFEWVSFFFQLTQTCFLWTGGLEAMRYLLVIAVMICLRRSGQIYVLGSHLLVYSI